MNTSEIEKMMLDIENRAETVLASNGKYVLKQDYELYENLIKSSTTHAIVKKVDRNKAPKISFKSVEDVDDAYENLKNKVVKIVTPTPKEEHLQTIFDECLDRRKIVGTRRYSWQNSLKGKKYYVNSWILSINDESNYSDEYKNIIFKMVQFRTFYKNREASLNDRFLNQIAEMIEYSIDISIGERQKLYGKLSRLTKLMEN